jgi:transcription elongation factor Elf1
MPKVIYKREIGVNMLGELEYTVLPTCPVCGEWTYREDTCPFCRMNGVLTELEYDGAKAPEFFDEKGNKAKCHCGTCGGIEVDWGDAKV